MAQSVVRLRQLVLVMVLGLINLAFAARSAGCGKQPSTRNGQTLTAQVNGKQRQYIVKLPDNYDRNRAYKLIFTYHALNGDAQQIANGGGGTLAYYGLPPLANNSAIFVSPNGINRGWGNQNNEDLTFWDTMVRTLESDLCVETTQRFATGFSYGGAMSFAIACARPNEIRAVGVLSSGLLSGCVGGSQPVAYYGQHGTRDSVLNVQMGRQMRDRFVQNNGCARAPYEPQPNGGRSVRYDYQNCRPDYPVSWVIHDGDHNPSQTDQGSNTPFAPANTWNFFNQFQAK